MPLLAPESSSTSQRQWGTGAEYADGADASSCLKMHLRTRETLFCSYPILGLQLTNYNPV